MRKRMYGVLLGLLALVFVPILSACSSVSTDSDMTSLHYSGGAFTATKFQDCVPTSTKDYNGPGDKYYNYPTSQRDFDATGGSDADANPVIVTSSDNAELSVPMVINFDLITDCKTLQKFHENLGNRYHAYWDKGATSDESPAGWSDMLRKKMGAPAAETLSRIAQKYPWREVWNNPEVKAEMERQVQGSIAALVERQAGGKYFENFEVLIRKPDPVKEGLKDAIALEQENVAKANAARVGADAEVTTAKSKAEVAEAQLRIARANAAAKKAEIAAFGNDDAYIKYLMVEKGLNPYQPSYGSALVDGR